VLWKVQMEIKIRHIHIVDKIYKRLVMMQMTMFCKKLYKYSYVRLYGCKCFPLPAIMSILPIYRESKCNLQH
jgi:hypothetical protein